MVLSTAAADAYRAYDLSQKQSCSLWIGRELLQSGSQEVLSFLRRFETIDNIEPPLCVIDGYGVDAEGRPFALFSPLDGYKVTGGNLEVSEVERRFGACMRLVALLHENGVVCGDLCGDSFWVTRDGEMLIVGLMGMLFSGPQAALSVAPAGTLPFVAPELFQGGAVTSASDVFSMGALAYHLLSGEFPYGAEGFRKGVGQHLVPIAQRTKRCLRVDTDCEH